MSLACETALKRFSEHLQCLICLKLPKNAHICPFCSALFCYGCISQWLTRPLEAEEADSTCCPHCRKDLQQTRLIKLQCFKHIEDLGPTLEQISDGATEVTEDCSQDTNKGILKPKHTVGHFTLRKFEPNKVPKRIFSKDIVDSLGSIWKLEVYPEGFETENYWLSVYVRLHKGLAGKYEYTIELINARPTKFTATNDFSVRSSWGQKTFFDTRALRKGTDLHFKLFVRPASFEEQCQLQTNLLRKLKASDDQLKGHPSLFVYYMDNFSANCKHGHYVEHEDNLNNVWEMGVDRSNNYRFLQFYVCMKEGFPGLYDLHLELTNYEVECFKKLNFQHQFSKNSKAFFNMQIRYNQLEDFGFTHFDDDYLEIRVSIIPVKVNMKSLQSYYCNDDSDPDLENDSGDEVYYH